ncbi:MAG: glutamine--fructose-6-phosphate transaminase (isomerizing) [Candidatus Fimimonas sp.]
MCGIFGTTADGCVQKTLQALHFLEYRGYDSAGMCVKNGSLQVFKTQGRVSVLEGKLPQNVAGESATGHTRWATHGAVCDKNAHPFLSQDGAFSICHNGILENYVSLKTQLQKEGFTFVSDTDSETIAHLLQKNFRTNVLQSVTETAKALQGSFAVLVQTTHDNNLYALKNKSPLAVGISEQGVFLCSDVRCVSTWTQKVAVVPDNVVVVAGKSDVRFFDFFGKQIEVEFFVPTAFSGQQQIEGDVMFKEICEIPQCLAQAKKHYFESGGLQLSTKRVKKLKRIYFLGCGTAYNSGLETCAVARNFCSLDMLAVISSEFIYDNYPVDSDTLAFCISQSGETADTIRAAEKVKQTGGIAYAVTNTDMSTLCFVCNKVQNVCAGAEFAVASTKAYNNQVQTLLLLMLDIAYLRQEISAEKRRDLWNALDKIPLAIDSILRQKQKIADLAQQIKHSSAVFFVGRTLDYPTAVEGSLKLKEISYVHSEAYPSGELKHGTLALMEKGVTVVVISTSSTLLEKNNGTANEIASRHATVVTVSPYRGTELHVTLPTVQNLLYGIVAVVPLQLLAYYVAKGLGRDVDKPRNLAKSVTVE